jgi:hypothetical protein
MGGDHLQARLALTAAQANLADGLTQLWVATVTNGSGALFEGGKSFVAAEMGSPVLVRASLHD